MQNKSLLKFLVIPFFFLFLIQELQAQGTYTFGTAATTNANTGYPAVYANYYGSTRNQYMIRASEMTGAGMSATKLSSIAFDVSALNGVAALSGFYIALKQVPPATSVLNATFQTGLTTVLGPITYNVTSGWNTHTFTTPFCWDGTSNLVVEVCFYNGSYTYNASTRYSAAGYNACHYIASDGGAQCAVASGGTVLANRPNIRLGTGAPGSFDLSVYDVTSPMPVIDVSGSSNTVSATIKNMSCSPITSATYGYKWNSGPAVTQAWTGSIVSGGSATFSFATPLTASPVGLNKLKVWTSQPNGTVDANKTNDTLTLDVFVKDVPAPSPASFQGKDFWVGFISNIADPENILQLHISSKTGATGLIYAKGASPVYAVPFTVAALGIANITLPFPFTSQATTDALNTRGINIVSDNDVVVYAGNYQPYSSDAATAIPTNALGTAYDIIAMGSASGTSALYYPGEFVVVATEDATTVTIKMGTTPSVTKAANSTTTATMNKGQTYHIASKTPGALPASTDLTGAQVTANKPVAVFAGDECIFVGNCAACDHLYEQVRPNNTWGKEHYLAATQKGSVTADVIRIYSSTGATVNINTGGATTTTTLAARSFTDVDLAGVGMAITSNNAVHVSQYLRGSSCSAPPLAIDPLMLDVLPIEQWGPDYIFSTSPYARYSVHYCTLVMNTAQTGSIQLNGAPITGVTWNTITGTAYSYGYKTLVAGTNYNITSSTNTPFGLFIYGYGQEESYGYTAGGFLTNLTVLPISLTNFEVYKLNGKANVVWETASEKNNKEFVLERSIDGIRYIPLAVIKGSGTTSIKHKYSYLDNFPELGTNYYRLKQIDLDGKFSYSSIRVFENSNILGTMIKSVIPNPFSNTTTFELSENDGEATITLYNVVGQELKKFFGKGSSITISRDGLDDGMYFYQIENSKGLLGKGKLMIE